jgi:hypothetical protein
VERARVRNDESVRFHVTRLNDDSKDEMCTRRPARLWLLGFVIPLVALLALPTSANALVQPPPPITGPGYLAPGSPVDILPYFVNTTGFTKTGTHPISDYVSGNDLWRVKWDAQAWEHWTVPFNNPNGTFNLVEDTSDPTHRYTFTAPMFPRVMAVGQQYTSDQLSGGAGNLETSYPATGPCTVDYQQQFPFTTELVDAVRNYYFGGDIGVANGIDLRYFYLNQTATGYEYEDNWYARKADGSANYGLVSWRLWHYDSTGAPVTEAVSTFTTMTTTPATAPDLSVAC